MGSAKWVTDFLRWHQLLRFYNRVQNTCNINCQAACNLYRFLNARWFFRKVITDKPLAMGRIIYYIEYTTNRNDEKKLNFRSLFFFCIWFLLVWEWQKIENGTNKEMLRLLGTALKSFTKNIYFSQDARPDPGTHIGWCDRQYFILYVRLPFVYIYFNVNSTLAIFITFLFLCSPIRHLAYPKFAI